jgi:8-oxo-dGTP pyrophosphatase MutT (NUDIX family)
VPVEARPAASVLLVRPGRTSPLECYLIRRAAGMRFLGGYYAFPGGKVDLADRTAEALGRVHGVTAEAAAGWLGATDDVPALAYWLTAVRELFEESGVLLAVDAAGRPVEAAAPRLEAHRQALVRGERSFPAILAAEGWRADARPLAYLSHFVTPPSSPIRFSARFFLCPLPPGQTPRVILEEASAGLWAAPGEAYARFRAGEWKMAEPAEYGTQYLAQFDSDDALWAHHADGRSKFDGIIDRLDAARFYLVAREAVLRRG